VILAVIGVLGFSRFDVGARRPCVPPNVLVQRRRADLRDLAPYPLPSAATGC